MVDSIVKCVKCTDLHGNLNYYDIFFLFGDLGSLSTVPVVTLKATDLQNPNDLNEVKTKACIQAGIIKLAVMQQLSLSYSDINDLNGEVTL